MPIRPWENIIIIRFRATRAVNANYRGPSWLITEMDGDRYMEQMRVRNPLTKNVSPLLVAGEVEWRDYTAQVKVRPLCTTEEAGLVFRYQTSLMNYAFYLNDQKVQFWKIHKKNRYTFFIKSY